jgi:hypothetical protein
MMRRATLEALASTVPHARLIVCLRDPLTRLKSQYVDASGWDPEGGGVHIMITWAARGVGGGVGGVTAGTTCCRGLHCLTRACRSRGVLQPGSAHGAV